MDDKRIKFIQDTAVCLSELILLVSTIRLLGLNTFADNVWNKAINLMRYTIDKESK